VYISKERSEQSENMSSLEDRIYVHTMILCTISAGYFPIITAGLSFIVTMINLVNLLSGNEYGNRLRALLLRPDFRYVRRLYDEKKYFRYPPARRTWEMERNCSRCMPTGKRSVHLIGDFQQLEQTV
jgi:hypothetical protein